MIQWQYKERASASNFRDNSHKLGIHRAEIRIVRISSDLYVVVASFSFEWHAVYMAELWAPHAAEPYLKDYKIYHLVKVNELR